LTGCISVSDSIVDDLNAHNYPVVITAVNSGYTNIAGGVDVQIRWKNISNKNIQHIYFDTTAYNAVNEIQACTVRLRYSARLRLKGPIKPNKSNNSSWGNVWKNKSIVYAEINYMRIDYTDGTSEEFDKLDIIKMSPNYRAR
jgi:hypothetical protein